MADEEALNYLKDRIKAEASSNRRSQATTSPIDATPETYMGASIATKSGDEDESNADATAASEEGNETIRKRRIRKSSRSRTAGTPQIDPELMTKILEELHTSVPVMEKEPPEGKGTPEPTNSSKSMVKQVEDTSALSPNLSLSKSSESSKASDEFQRVRKELEDTKLRLEEVTERLEDYDILCENLLADESPEARLLAKYIGELLEKTDESEQDKEKLRSLEIKLETTQKELKLTTTQANSANDEILQLREDLEVTQKNLDEQKSKNAHLVEVSGSDNEAIESHTKYIRRISLLESKLDSKDAEIEELKNKLQSAQQDAMAILPEGLENAEEDELFVKAEEDLRVMEQLIKEQEEFMESLEMEMEKALEDMPPSVRERFIKEREKILADSAGKVEEAKGKNEDRESGEKGE